MSKIKMLVMDVDGTLTDGRIIISPQGELAKAFDVKDGYGIAQILPKFDIIPVIITGRKSDIVTKRANELGIKHCYQGIANKLQKLTDLATELYIKANEIAYIGDDLNDFDCIKYCGYSACPNDAVDKIIDTVTYVCTKNGGNGAVREFIDHLTRI